MLSFGEDYGSYCAAWEDGACSESLDLKKCTNGPGHTCGSKKGCHELWEDYNFNQDQLWCVVLRVASVCWTFSLITFNPDLADASWQCRCCDSWCYVNATTCKGGKFLPALVVR